MLFLIELSSTLGHLSLSIKEVSADGTITSMSVVSALSPDDASWPSPAPLGTDAPT